MHGALYTVLLSDLFASCCKFCKLLHLPSNLSEAALGKTEGRLTKPSDYV
jgi:hypothetical protein